MMSVRPILSLALMPMLSLAVGTLESGLKVGEAVPAFEPTHVTGPDKGTETCPVCKYGMTPAVQVWVKGDTDENLGKLAEALEAKIAQKGDKKLKVFFVFLDAKVKSGLSKFAEEHKLENVALTYLKPDQKLTMEAYAINTSKEVKNTVMVYSKREVVKNFVNLEGSEAGLKSLGEAVDAAVKVRYPAGL